MKEKYEKKYELMCKTVTVRAVLERQTLTNKEGEVKRLWLPKKLKRPRVGWVIGYRTVFSGKVVTFRNGPLEGYEEETALKYEQQHPCLLVVFWPTMNPVRVAMDAFTVGGEPEPPGHEWSEKDRKKAFKDMADWPRDERGRWKSVWGVGAH